MIHSHDIQEPQAKIHNIIQKGEYAQVIFLKPEINPLPVYFLPVCSSIVLALDNVDSCDLFVICLVDLRYRNRTATQQIGKQFGETPTMS